MPARTTNSLAPFGKRTHTYRDKEDLVRIATFNINNINKRLDNLLAWLAEAEPDVVSLQELKAEQGAFPANALRTLGYEAVWHGERSWNGVAILARNHAPVLTCSSLPGNPGFPVSCAPLEFKSREEWPGPARAAGADFGHPAANHIAAPLAW
jgi:endonuclease/exonuclease/phosphatase (EEP) superfamily protein YafD